VCSVPHKLQEKSEHLKSSVDRIEIDVANPLVVLSAKLDAGTLQPWPVGVLTAQKLFHVDAVAQGDLCRQVRAEREALILNLSDGETGHPKLPPELGLAHAQTGTNGSQGVFD
jgi:hypothetical protein